MRGSEGWWVSLNPKPGVRKPATTNEDLFPRTPFERSRSERRALRMLAMNRHRILEARVLPEAEARGPSTAPSNTSDIGTVAILPVLR
jgi:hypothetical protein